MQLSPRTLQILKNFATINQSLCVSPGKVLSTLAPLRTTFALANVEETFERAFAIYDLPRFLGVMTLLNNPDLSFHDTYIQLKDGRQKINFTYADPELLVRPPEGKTIKTTNIISTVTIPPDMLSSLIKAVGTMQFPNIVVESDGDKISIVGKNIANPSTDRYDVLVSEDKTQPFEAVLLASDLKLLAGGYTLDVSSKGRAHFKTAEGDVEYWIPFQSSSKF